MQLYENPLKFEVTRVLTKEHQLCTHTDRYIPYWLHLCKELVICYSWENLYVIYYVRVSLWCCLLLPPKNSNKIDWWTVTPQNGYSPIKLFLWAPHVLFCDDLHIIIYSKSTKYLPVCKKFFLFNSKMKLKSVHTFLFEHLHITLW